MPDFARLEPPRTVGDLFVRQPRRMGARGDAHLWEELRLALADAPLPEDRWALERLLERAWETAMGTRLNGSDAPIYVPRFDPGSGMSAGQVIPSWWFMTGIVILIDRFCAFSGEG